MTPEKLQDILIKHKLWLDSDPDGSRADLSRADLRRADLSRADLRDADLRGADLRRADLSRADLRDADLRDADLRDADLSRADLRDADLSRAEGLLSTVNFLESHFERTEDGYIAYKTFGSQYTPPESWKIEPGSVISENVLFDRCSDCGCGINVAPLDWVRHNYSGTIWKVLIRWEWLCGVCAPYHSDGKIRCERVELIETVN